MIKHGLVLLFGLALAMASGAEEALPPPGKNPEPAPAIDETTQAKLAEALECVNLSLHDLGWNKRPLDDGYRLKCVNDTLDHPLALASWAEKAEQDFAGDPLASVLAGASWLDVAAPMLVNARDPFAGLDDAPAWARPLLKEAAGAYFVAEAQRKAALGPLTDGERATLTKSGRRLYADEEAGDIDAAPALAAAKKIDLAPMFVAAQELARGAANVRTLLVDFKAENWRTTSWVVNGITVELGGPGDDRHTGADVVLDLGGDDIYRDCKVVIDLKGDDDYRNCGSGHLACGLILDLAGNDRYRGGDFSQGGAAFGVAISIDVAGDDRYEADECSQGAAFFGIGMLFDLAGNDGYRGARFVQGFGGTRGLGVLSDMAGNDTYYAGGTYSHAPLLPEHHQTLSQGFGFGLRGSEASGGVGALCDHAGNDVYMGEVFAQGCSYWFALGLLVDTAGHDRYECYRYGQGSGIHLSPAVLFDRAGDDSYVCNTGVAQGCGHDWGVGLLLDLNGDDYYTGAGMTQGGANANGFGLCIDRRGNDSYSGTHNSCQGFSFQSRGTFGLGVLLDLGGADQYTAGGANNRVWTRTTVGVGLDWEEKK